MKASNQLQGATNRAQGAHLENIIEQSCGDYAEREIAYIEKTPEPFRPMGRPTADGRFTGHYTAKAQPDFKGTICGGRAICFEAKETSTDRIEQKRVTPEQAAALELHSKLGALCGVMVSLSMQDYYFVPWVIWREMKENFGHKYMARPELEKFRVRFTGARIKFLREDEQK